MVVGSASRVCHDVEKRWTPGQRKSRFFCEHTLKCDFCALARLDVTERQRVALVSMSQKQDIAVFIHHHGLHSERKPARVAPMALQGFDDDLLPKLQRDTLSQRSMSSVGGRLCEAA